MLTLQILRHAHLSEAGRPVAVSRKAVALLSYLTLEGQPQHRETLAELLWDGPGSMMNLRVELTRLRQQGLELFAPRQPLLSLRLDSDLDAWLAAAPGVQEGDLAAWLAPLEGVPLGGLDDLGSPAFRAWLDLHRSRIGALIDAALSQVHARLARQGRGAGAEAVRRVALERGLNLGAVAAPAPDPAGRVLALDCSEELGRVRQIMTLALEVPQFLVIRAQPGSARSLLGAAAAGSGWHLIQLQDMPDKGLLRHALLRQLIALCPPDEHAVLEQRLVDQTDRQNLLMAVSLLSGLGTPVLIALHGVVGCFGWATDLLGLLMDLRAPLLLVVCPAGRTLGDGSLANLDWSRIHELVLPGLSRQAIHRLLQQDSAGNPVEDLHGRAAQIAQASEGWPPYVEALLGPGPVSWRVPAPLSARIRTLTSSLDAGTRTGLATLAQIRDRFPLSLATALLGESGARAVQAGVELGMIVHTAPQESLEFPAFSNTTDDASSRLGFVSEVVRGALAGSLTPSERQEIRRQLAALLLDSQPALSLHYAERSQEPELAARARAALPARLPLRWQSVCVQPVPAGAVVPPAPGRRVWDTPNGYHVHWQAGELEVRRRGRPATPPRLNLGTVQAGTWTMTLRLDVFHSAPDIHLELAPYAVGVGVGSGPRQMFAPAPTGESVAAPLAEPGEYYAGLPLGQTVRLCGRWEGPPGPLVLSFQAVNVACTIHSLRWANLEMILPPGGVPARQAAAQQRGP